MYRRRYITLLRESPEKFYATPSEELYSESPPRKSLSPAAGKEFNEEIAAFVILKTQVDAADLIHWCKDSLARYKVPRQIYILKEFPRTSLGKVIKADLSHRLEPL
jgi:acyl-CoA synthetase (AMP-forming)/AMP-acid ligase II